MIDEQKPTGSLTIEVVLDWFADFNQRVAATHERSHALVSCVFAADGTTSWPVASAPR
jgi:hypothetical protein